MLFGSLQETVFSFQYVQRDRLADRVGSLPLASGLLLAFCITLVPAGLALGCGVVARSFAGLNTPLHTLVARFSLALLHLGFSMWLAGGGIQGGLTYGSTDDYSVNVAEDGVHVHDVHATILHLLGIDHKRLTYKYQGRDFRLTDVHGKVVTPILA